MTVLRISGLATIAQQDATNALLQLILSALLSGATPVAAKQITTEDELTITTEDGRELEN
jgi:hypothetical protein